MAIPENINPLLDEQARFIAEQAQRGYDELLALIASGVNPVEAVQRVQETFNGAYKEQMQQAFTEVMGRTVTAAEVAKMPVSGIPLSAKLYRNTLQTSMEVGALVKAHAAGMHDARALAIRLYDGYNPRDGIQRPIENRSLAKLPKPLRDLLRMDPALKGSYETLLGQVQQSAAILKSAALKASYMELIDKWQQGDGYDSLKKKLDVAYREKTRFHANRIAQTELARAHQDKVGAEFMLDDSISVVQVVMSPAHPLVDICDFHARANLFNLGPGCYPKDKAPKPVYHPFCRCIVRSRPDLSAGNAREKVNGEAAYLRTMPIPEAARIVGGRDRLQRILNGTPFDDVLNASKNKEYHLMRLGQLDLSVVHPARVALGMGLDNPGMKKPQPLVSVPAKNTPKPPPIRPSFSGAVTTGFRQDVRSAIASLPKNVSNRLAAEGCQIEACRRVTNFDPLLKGVQPRGWPNGMTWDNADGFARGKTAVVAEEFLFNGKWRSSGRAQGVFRHEVGHVADTILGNTSTTPAFRAAHALDIAALKVQYPFQIPSSFDYFMQTGDAGPSETFAEVFAQLHGTGSSGANIVNAFPNVVNLMKPLIQGM